MNSEFSSQEKINSEYRKWKDWHSQNFGALSVDDVLYFREELRRIGFKRFAGLNVLEVGFGNGSFAEFCRTERINYIGCEVDARLTENAISKGFTAINSSAADLAKHQFNVEFDLVVAFDVLEHLCVRDIGRALAAFRVLLRNNGRILARIPSGDSPFVGPIFNGDITHRSLLGSVAIEQLAAAHGYRVVAIESPVLPVFGNGLIRSIRRICVRVAQRSASSLINLLFNEGKRRVISSNMIFVLEKSSKIDELAQGC